MVGAPVARLLVTVTVTFPEQLLVVSDSPATESTHAQYWDVPGVDGAVSLIALKLPCGGVRAR